MESAVNIANPEVGVGGAEVGSPTYVAAKFNNGILSDIANEGCTFPTGANNINLDKGTIEFWAKINFETTEVDYHDFIWAADYANGGVRLLFNPSLDDFWVIIVSGGIEVVVINTVGLSWNSGDLLHFGLTWDRQGNDIGGGKTVALYVDNVLEASSLITWSTDSILANMCVGYRPGTKYSLAVIDQLKTYDTCKIDFSDRNTEHCNGNNPPSAPSGQQVNGQNNPTGANCVTSTPQFTAIYNDPDAGDQSNAIEIQVGSASGLSDMWNSGWLVDSTIDGNRCNAKNYAGAALSAGTSYWWRCRFRDDENAEGAWSEWQEFYVCAAEPELGVGLLECAPGGPLPKRCPFRCAVALPRRVPSWLY